MPEDELALLRKDIDNLRREIKKLVKSDRVQTHKLKWQYRTSMFLLGFAAIGAVALFGNLSAEDKASLERVAMGVLAAGVSGAVGVSLPGFTPPGAAVEPEEEGEDAD